MQPVPRSGRSPVPQLLVLVTVALTIFGLLMVFSSSSVQAFQQMGDSQYYFKRQLGFSLGGLALVLFIWRLPYRKLKTLSLLGLAIAVALLVAVLIPGIGTVSNGARRWIDLGAIRFQPSEFAKIALLVFGASVLAQKRGKFRNLKDLMHPFGWVVGLLAFLVLLEPDMGTALILTVSAVVLVFLAGVPFRWLGLIGSALGALALLAIWIEPYRLTRMLSFFDPWGQRQEGGFQIVQSLLAFGSGGLTGQGLGNGHQKFYYLPQSSTDFIFAIVGEELGLAGCLLLLGLFLALGYLGIRIALRAPDNFGRLLAAGITGAILTQALLNLAAVTAVVPVTGVPLPFISYGGSALIGQLAGVGILLSIARAQRMEVLSARSDLRRRDRGSRPPRPSARRRTAGA